MKMLIPLLLLSLICLDGIASAPLALEGMACSPADRADLRRKISWSINLRKSAPSAGEKMSRASSSTSSASGHTSHSHANPHPFFPTPGIYSWEGMLAPPHDFSRGNQKRPGAFDSLPPLPLLYAAIDTFHAHTARADLLELQESRRGNWLKYLPTLGLAYTPSGAPRPGLSYSTAVIYQAKKDKQTRAAKRLAILEQAQLAARRDKAALGPLLERHRSAERELAAALQLLELDRELLSYWQQELAAKNIGPVEFLGKRKAFMEQETGIERLRDRLRELEAELLAKAHFFDP